MARVEPITSEPILVGKPIMWHHWGFWKVTLAICSFSALVATLGKDFANGWHSYTHKGPERGFLDAKKKGLYLAKFRINPPVLKHGDLTFEFGEAWVEARYEPNYFLVWFSEEKRMDWDYFCVRTKTDMWFQKDIDFSLTPEFFPPYEYNEFSYTSDFWYQRVPTNLKRVRITVTAKLRDKAEIIPLGTAELTRQ